MIKYCPNCKIEVGGTFEYCPLCQNELEFRNATLKELLEKEAKKSNASVDADTINDTAMNNTEDDSDDLEATMSAVSIDPYFPYSDRLKTQSFWYKLQMFIVCAATFICFAVDFLIIYDRDLHWSLIVLLWVVGFELLLNKLIKHHSLPTYFVFYISFYVGMLLLPTAYYLGFFKLCVNYIIPCICTLALALNFIFCMLDKSGNAMVYMLCNVLVGVLPSIIMIAINGMAPLFWIICMIATVVSIFALVIFVGPKVRNEIIKRLNF